MKLLIFSDSHYSISAMEEAIEKKKHDGIIFLGDCVKDAELLQRYFPLETILIIKGNNDFYADYREFAAVCYEGHKVLAVHGHREGVKRDLLALKYKAQSENCEVALFGHTHTQVAFEKDGILFLNPGAIWGKENYAILTLEKGKKPSYELF